MLRLLGCEICADTLVGNEMLRGISGGQKKRVTTGGDTQPRPHGGFSKVCACPNASAQAMREGAHQDMQLKLVVIHAEIALLARCR